MPIWAIRIWTTFNGVAGGHYELMTTGLGPNSDTVLELYGSDGSTRLLRNDDVGKGAGRCCRLRRPFPALTMFRALYILQRQRQRCQL